MLHAMLAYEDIDPNKPDRVSSEQHHQLSIALTNLLAREA